MLHPLAIKPGGHATAEFRRPHYQHSTGTSSGLLRPDQGAKLLVLGGQVFCHLLVAGKPGASRAAGRSIQARPPPSVRHLATTCGLQAQQLTALRSLWLDEVDWSQCALPTGLTALHLERSDIPWPDEVSISPRQHVHPSKNARVHVSFQHC